MCALQILMHFERCVRSTGHVRPESIPCAHDLAMSCALARSGWSKLRPGTHPCGHVAAVCGCVSGAWWGTPHAGCWLKCLRWKKKYLTPVLLAVLGGLGSPQRCMRVAGGRAAGDFATRQARFPTVGYRCEAGSVLPTSSSSTLEIYSGIVWLSFFCRQHECVLNHKLNDWSILAR